MSERPSLGSPCACSGDRYAAVPMIAAVCATVSAVVVTRAMPKSVTFTSPRGSSMMLPGLMSRWITPRACAASSARSTSIAMSIARSGRMRPPPARISASVRPSTYSITMKCTPSSEPVSKTETMFGWVMLAAACASRRNRCTKLSSSAYWGARTFTATVRPSTVSVPRKTLAMPPRPSSRSMR